MKKKLSMPGRSLMLAGVLVPLLAAFVYVALRSGPLAPVPVTVATVSSQAIAPALFGIGTVEARYTHRIGPVSAGRLRRVEVQPGDRVKPGQLLGEMDPVDLDERIAAQDAALKRAAASVQAARAQTGEADARQTYAAAQALRYEQLLASHTVSAEAVEAKRQEAQVAQAGVQTARANLEVAQQELGRLQAERAGLLQQRANLRLLAPVAGLITRRDAEPGTTVVAGQTVVEVVAPGSIWVNARFDQQRSSGLVAQLPAQIVLRSRAGALLAGRVARVEPHADPVTEELLAKIDFTPMTDTVPPLGELAEVTIVLAGQPATPVVPNASLQRVAGELGVWVVADGELRFAPVKTGVADLDGRVQILQGLEAGEEVVVYSRKQLTAGSRIQIVESIAGAPK